RRAQPFGGWPQSWAARTRGVPHRIGRYRTAGTLTRETSHEWLGRDRLSGRCLALVAPALRPSRAVREPALARNRRTLNLWRRAALADCTEQYAHIQSKRVFRLLLVVYFFLTRRLYQLPSVILRRCSVAGRGVAANALRSGRLWKASAAGPGGSWGGLGAAAIAPHRSEERRVGKE